MASQTEYPGDYDEEMPSLAGPGRCQTCATRWMDTGVRFWPICCLIGANGDRAQGWLHLNTNGSPTTETCPSWIEYRPGFELNDLVVALAASAASAKALVQPNK